MAIAAERKIEIIAEFEARKEARVYVDRKNFKSDTAFKKAVKAENDEYYSFNADFRAALMGTVSGADAKLAGLAEEIYQFAQDSEYSASVRGLASAYFDTAEIALSAYAIGKNG